MLCRNQPNQRISAAYYLERVLNASLNCAVKQNFSFFIYYFQTSKINFISQVAF
jgi:hypothetical protein